MFLSKIYIDLSVRVFSFWLLLPETRARDISCVMNRGHMEYDVAVYKRRRGHLARILGDTPAWICAGGAVSRNYEANTYPYRASSHFLYLVGRPLLGASLFFHGETIAIVLPPADPADALWHGPVSSISELSEQLGCDVCEEYTFPHEVAAVPAPDMATRLWQEKRLGRPLFPRTDYDLHLEDALIELRLRHDDNAASELRLAAQASVAAHHAGMAKTHPGVTEAAVRAAMEAEIMARGMTTAYSSIVSVRGEILHNPHSDGVGHVGDLLLADVGAETPRGWAGDITRTWPISGSFSPSQRDIYTVVLNAQKHAIAKCVPGARYRDIHLEASRVLTQGLIDLGVLRGDPSELVADGVHALFFPHGIGHLLGLDVHDMEDLGDRAGYAPGRSRSNQFGLSYLRLDRDLEPGMAVTIEPGFYIVPSILENSELTQRARDRLDRDRLASFSDVRGIRIEDDVLITHDGHEVLSRALPKEIGEIEILCS